MSSSTSNDWLEKVRKFHFSFDHPIASPEGRVLSESRRVARASWLIEELIEFMRAEEVVDQVDALLDFVYFCFGNLVEIGADDVSMLDAEFTDIEGAPADLAYSYRVSFASRASESVFQFLRSDTRRGQYDFTVDAARTMLRCLRVMRVNPAGLMEIVHQSNMGKLWPDGKPKFSDDGKVIKPPTWEPPEKEMAKIIDTRVSEWFEENKDEEIPF